MFLSEVFEKWCTWSHPFEAYQSSLSLLLAASECVEKMLSHLKAIAPVFVRYTVFPLKE